TLLDFEGRELPLFDFDGGRCESGAITSVRPAPTNCSEMADFSYSFQVTLQYHGTIPLDAGPAGLVGHRLTNTQDPGKPIAADRNPYSNSIIKAAKHTYSAGSADFGGWGLYGYERNRNPSE